MLGSLPTPITGPIARGRLVFLLVAVVAIPEVLTALGISVARTLLATFRVVLHLRVAKPDNLVVAVLVLDKDSKLLTLSRGLLGFVVPRENLAGIADLFAHSPKRPKI